ncbi:hypothetical protein ACFIJ5_15235 [Haloimpatiens sp. FM7330]|uniref:hypothetical protein n=1 Tax=Haloimpatiens sp. FM7330 TaxID=3298610 RepID=UPI0036307EBF
MKNEKNLNKKGSALPIAIIVGILIISMSAILISTITNEVYIRKGTEERVKAKYIAEAGIENGIYLYNLKVKNNESIKENFSHRDSVGDLGNYYLEYNPPLENSNIAIFYSTGITKDNKSIKMQAKLDTSNGRILSWDELK